MYLSRIALDTKRRETMRAFVSPHILHGAVESSFPHSPDRERERTLWRVDYLGEMCYLLILSIHRPDFTHMAEQFGYPHPNQQWEIKDYDPLLTRLKSGQVWQFRLRANPVHSSVKEKDEASGRGRVFAHVTQEQQRQWLLKREKGCGFTLDENSFDVVHTEWKKFSKARGSSREITLRTAVFEGMLTISDVELFKRSLLSGIGRAKAYGCGLLTIARCGGGCDD